ncbi:hypothetical protein BC941DRAFT_425973 [Chlamydoabsidia padenii]|nr:hypothetical protein BC941DRAFT_425973 [Chlamydoabsidia padenii]
MFAGQRPRPLSLKRPATLTKDPWSEPASPAPTFSSLSSNELVVLLKNAHVSLREKEKDLTLAAELGHYLLENNITLKSQYDALLQQQQQQQQEQEQQQKEQTEEDWGYYYGKDHDSNQRLTRSSSYQCNKAAHQMELAELQDKNMELQRLLEDAQQQADKLQAVHDKKARELEHDVTVLKDHLDMATQKIEEMEDDEHYRSVRQRRQHDQDQHTRTERHASGTYDQLYQQHDSLIAELRNKISQLEYENGQLVRSRRSVQERLDRALYDVETLQTQFNLGEWSRESCAQLHDAYQRQLDHIAQLNESLEEHRHILTSLVDNGVLADWNINMINKSIRNDHHPHNQTDHFLPTNNNLMTELEQAWHRDQLTKEPAAMHIGIQQQQQQQQQQYDHHFRNNAIIDDDGYSSLQEGFKQQQRQQQQQHRFGYLDNTNAHKPSPASAHAHHLPTFSDNKGNQVYNHMIGDDYDDYDDDTDDDDEDDELYGPLDSTDAITSYNLYPNLTGRYGYPTTITTGLMMAGLKGREQHQEEAAAGVVHKVQRWCRFAIVLTVAVFINAFEGPDTMLEESYY